MKLRHWLKAFLLITCSAHASAGFFSSEPKEKFGDWQSKDCPTRHSLAWCITNLGVKGEELNLFDVELDAEQSKALTETHIVRNTAMTVGAVAQFHVPIGSVPKGVGALAFLPLSGLFSSSAQKTIALQKRIIYFLPADNPAIAIDAFSKTFANALAQVLGATPSFEDDQVYFNGGRCGEHPCYMPLWSRIYKEDHLKPTTLPEYMGGKNTLSGQFSFYLAKRGVTERIVFNADDFAALSEKLPSYVYIYTGPAAVPDVKIPLLYGQGSNMLFVRNK
jgi:hypothetical protein